MTIASSLKCSGHVHFYSRLQKVGQTWVDWLVYYWRPVEREWCSVLWICFNFGCTKLVTCFTWITSVTIPRDILKKVGPAADRLCLSNQQVTGVLASIVNHSGGNLDDVSISTSTARNSRTTARKEAASYIKKTFSFTCGQINFDGKLLQELGGTEKVNRLAVVAVQEEENQLLCVTKTEDSTGKVEADAEKEAINNWGLSEGIIACCFDTTSSNSGINSGSCVLLQQLLNRQLLWLACRHHIPELILKAAFQSLFGKTTSPVETLFSTLKSSWKSLDLSNLSCPPTTACYRSSVDSILEFLDDRLLSDNLQHLTRGDYKELLELSKVCLGGTIERKKTYSYQLSRPGADHHARWVSQCLYILKLSLLQHQIDTISPQTKKKINTMASFILFVYIKFWISSPSLTRAATNDIQLYKQITTFKRVDKNVSAAALVALQRHTWYLTEDCISIALFNPDLEDEEKNKLAQILESYQQHSWRSESQHYLQFLPALRSLILLENAPSSYSPSLRWTTNNSFFKRTGKKQINMMLPEKLFQIFILLMTLQKGL